MMHDKIVLDKFCSRKQVENEICSSWGLHCSSNYLVEWSVLMILEKDYKFVIIDNAVCIIAPGKLGLLTIMMAVIPFIRDHCQVVLAGRMEFPFVNCLRLQRLMTK